MHCSVNLQNGSIAMSKPLASTLEPDTRAWLRKLQAVGGRPIYELSPKDARQVLSDIQSGTNAEKLLADIEDRTIGEGVPVRIVKPVGPSGPLPVIMHFHGGGWVLGGKDTHDRL